MGMWKWWKLRRQAEARGGKGRVGAKGPFKECVGWGRGQSPLFCVSFTPAHRPLLTTHRNQQKPSPEPPGPAARPSSHSPLPMAKHHAEHMCS